MNIDQFRTLISVAKNKSIVRASEEVYLTPPAIIRQLRLLEEEYRIKIFEIKSKKRILTEDGKILVDYAERVLNLVNESKKILDEKDKKLKGTLRIASIFGIGVYALPKILRLFSEIHPDVMIDLKLENSDDVIRDVKRHSMNFGFVGRKPGHSNISSHLFYQDKMCVVVGRELAERTKVMSWKMLQGLTFLRREKGSDIRDAIDEWLEQHNVHLNTKLESNNTEALKTCIKCGLGFSLLPFFTIEEDVKAGFLGIISVPHFNLVQNYYICHYRHKLFSKPEKVFLQFLFQSIESRNSIVSPPLP